MTGYFGWYAPDGRRIGDQEANALMKDGALRRVAHTKLVTSKGSIEVSTVFLFLDHGYFGDGPPVLWETMVFGGPVDQHQWRYTSRGDAEAGHAEAVAWVRTACDVEGADVLAEETFRPGGDGDGQAG